jgi:hypothetical protein
MKEEREKSKTRIPSYKLPLSPGHPSLAQQSPPPTPQLLMPVAAQQQDKEDESLDTLEPSTGSGFTNHGSGITQCPNNVLADVERLEILIGGKRAGNNSPEIINETADICKRLFTGGIMDIDMYQSLIEEITDDYYSD